MCSAKPHVRFAPNSDRESGFPQTGMSALPPKADMCDARMDVCFGPIADIKPSVAAPDAYRPPSPAIPHHCWFPSNLKRLHQWSGKSNSRQTARLAQARRRNDQLNAGHGIAIPVEVCMSDPPAFKDELPPPRRPRRLRRAFASAQVADRPSRLKGP
jgi:hypothetical protein